MGKYLGGNDLFLHQWQKLKSFMNLECIISRMHFFVVPICFSRHVLLGTAFKNRLSLLMNWFGRLLSMHWNQGWTKGFPSSFSSFTSSCSCFCLSKFFRLTFLFLMMWVGKNWASPKHWDFCLGLQWQTLLDWRCTGAFLKSLSNKFLNFIFYSL